MRTIEIIISPRGETRLQTKGFAGSACQEASRSWEEVLGRVQSEQLTAEFYQQQAAVNHLRQRGEA